MTRSLTLPFILILVLSSLAAACGGNPPVAGNATPPATAAAPATAPLPTATATAPPKPAALPAGSPSLPATAYPVRTGTGEMLTGEAAQDRIAQPGTPEREQFEAVVAGMGSGAPTDERVFILNTSDPDNPNWTYLPGNSQQLYVAVVREGGVIKIDPSLHDWRVGRVAGVEMVRWQEVTPPPGADNLRLVANGTTTVIGAYQGDVLVYWFDTEANNGQGDWRPNDSTMPDGAGNYSFDAERNTWVTQVGEVVYAYEAGQWVEVVATAIPTILGIFNYLGEPVSDYRSQLIVDYANQFLSEKKVIHPNAKLFGVVTSDGKGGVMVYFVNGDPNNDLLTKYDYGSDRGNGRFTVVVRSNEHPEGYFTLNAAEFEILLAPFGVQSGQVVSIGDDGEGNLTAINQAREVIGKRMTMQAVDTNGNPVSVPVGVPGDAERLGDGRVSWGGYSYSYDFAAQMFGPPLEWYATLPAWSNPSQIILDEDGKYRIKDSQGKNLFEFVDDVWKDVKKRFYECGPNLRFNLSTTASFSAYGELFFSDGAESTIDIAGCAMGIRDPLPDDPIQDGFYLQLRVWQPDGEFKDYDIHYGTLFRNGDGVAKTGVCFSNGCESQPTDTVRSEVESMIADPKRSKQVLVVLVTHFDSQFADVSTTSALTADPDYAQLPRAILSGVQGSGTLPTQQTPLVSLQITYGR